MYAYFHRLPDASGLFLNAALMPMPKMTTDRMHPD
jgi:hypothetical protein